MSSCSCTNDKLNKTEDPTGLRLFSHEGYSCYFHDPSSQHHTVSLLAFCKQSLYWAQNCRVTMATTFRHEWYTKYPDLQWLGQWIIYIHLPLGLFPARLFPARLFGGKDLAPSASDEGGEGSQEVNLCQWSCPLWPHHQGCSVVEDSNHSPVSSPPRLHFWSSAESAGIGRCYTPSNKKNSPRKQITYVHRESAYSSK